MPANEHWIHWEGEIRTDTVKGLQQTFRRSHAALELVPKWKTGTRKPSIYYDLQQCPDIDPGAILLLWHAATQHQARGHHVLATTGGMGASKKLFNNLNHYLLPIEERPKPGTAVDYLMRKIDDPDRSSIELQDWAEIVTKGTGASPERVAFWQSHMGEVTTNCFQHSCYGMPDAFEPFVVVAGKVYPDSGRVQLAALDFGAGLPATVRRVVRGLTDEAAIVKTFERSFTAGTTDDNQGSGLANVADAVISGQGQRLYALSGNGLGGISRRKTFEKGIQRPRGSGCAGSNVRCVDGTLIILNLRL